MKKILSVILSLTMTSGTVGAFADDEVYGIPQNADSGALTLQSAAETLNYDEQKGFYANRENLRIPFTEDISGVTDENVAENVVLSDADGKAIAFAASATGKELILVPEEEFVLDEIYIFSVKQGFGTETSVLAATKEAAFKVVSIMETDLENETDITKVFTSANPAGGTGTRAIKYALHDGYAYTEGQYNMLYLNGDYAAKERYTVEFSLKLFKTRNNTAIVFNNQNRKMADGMKDTSFGWINDTSSSYHKPAYKLDTAGYKAVKNADASVVPIYNNSAVVWSGNEQITSVGASENVNYYRIDKCATAASLYLKTSQRGNYQLVDTFDTSELGDVPLVGYFGFGTLARTSPPTVAVGDIVITQSIEAEIEEGDITLDESAELVYSAEKAVLTFNTDLTPVNLAELKQYIKVTDSEGVDVSCSFVVDGKAISVIPDDGFVPEQTYTIAVGAGLGFLRTRVREDIVKSFAVALQEIHVAIADDSDMEIDTKQFVVPFDTDIGGVTENIVKKFVTLFDAAGESLDYSAKINADKLIINPSAELVFNNEYRVNIKKGFGYSNKLLAEDYERGFTVKTVPISVEGKLYANVKRLTVPLDRVLGGNVDFSCISVTDEKSRRAECDFLINEKNLEIVPQNGFERDTVYTVEIKRGFGTGVYRTVQDIDRSFVLKTIAAPDFEKDDVDSYFTYGVGAQCFQVKDGKLFYNFGVKPSEVWSNYAYFKSDEKYNTKQNYSVSFDIEYYGGAIFAVAFNTDGNVKNIVYPGVNNLTAFLWNINTASPALSRTYALAGGGFNGTNKFGSSDVEVPGAVAAEPVTYNDDFTIADVPNGAQSYNYTIDKIGTKGYFYLDNVLADVYDSQKAIEHWNEHYSEHSAATAVPVTYNAPSEGYFAIGANGFTKADQTVAISNLQMTEFAELEKSESIELREVDTDYSANVLSTKITVKNYYNEDKPVTVGVLVYGEKEKLLGAQFADLGTVAANSSRDCAISLEADNAVKMRVLLWDRFAAGKLLCSPYVYDLLKSEVTEETPVSDPGEQNKAGIQSVGVKNYDADIFTDYLVSMTGNIAPSEKDRYITLMVLKSDIEPGNISKIDSSCGNVVDLLIKGNHTSFTYDFEMDNDLAPTGESYKYIVKAIGDNVDLSSAFIYANEQDTINFVKDKLAVVDVSFGDLEKYSACLGIDVSEFDNEGKQNVLIETLKNAKEEIGKAEDIVESVNNVIKEASAKVIILRRIHRETTTAADVNTVITKYAQEAKLSLENYNKLSQWGKTGVCNALIGKDFETSGFEEFYKEFERLIAAQPKPGGGGNGGSSGSSSSGGGVTGLTPSDISNIVNDMQMPFKDIGDYKWAEQYIQVLYKKGIITGITNDSFAPEKNVTREQFAVMVVKAFDIATEGKNADFCDVDKERWSYPYIATAKESGIMTGNDKGYFNPQSFITREDMAVVLYRASVNAGRTYRKAKTDYLDFEQISGYAKDAVSYLVGEEIINGFGDGTFRGKEYANRAQAAKLICLIIGGE